MRCLNYLEFDDGTKKQCIKKKGHEGLHEID